MIRGLYTAVSGLITQEAKQDTITNNMANANTVGFKSDNLAVKSFKDVLIQNYDKLENGKNVQNTIGRLNLGSGIDEITTDFTQGMIQSTDKATDFAIEGRGFFTVQRDGQEYFTRDGHFHADGQGNLITDSGDAVVGIDTATGAKGNIVVGNNPIKSDEYGNLVVGDRHYKLRVVDFSNDDYKGLQKIGDNLYQASNVNPVYDGTGIAPSYEGNNLAANKGIVVRQNSLEKSNINVINEMVNMMTVMRSFESNQKVVQAMDETLGKAVNEVGTVR